MVISHARLTRGLAGALSLWVSITCGSPVSPISKQESDPSVARSGTGTTVRVTIAQSPLDVGDSTVATAALVSAWGKEFHGARTTWSSSNRDVATIDETGKIRGVSAGLADIVASTQGVIGKAQITVRDHEEPPPPIQVATRLGIATQPGGGITGAALSPQPVIHVRDSAGAVVTTSNATVTVTISGGSAALIGSTSIAAVNGVASFTNLGVIGVGSFTLTFVSSGLDGATSNAITIVAGGPAALAMATQPATSAVTGAILSTQPAVDLRDAFGNPVRRAGVSVTAALSGTGATLGGTTTIVTDQNGVASFTNLAITGIGTFALTFSSSGLSSVTSTGITLGALPATQVSVGTQPSSSAVSGQPFATQPIIILRDALGNAVRQSGVGVTAAIASGGGTLSGLTTVATDANGIAQFTDVAISGTAGTRTLRFTAAGLLPATSQPINVTVPTGDGRGLIFASDWSTATGTTESARRDLGKARPWSMYAGNAPSGVESAASLGLTDWPTANAFVVRTSQAAMGSMWAQLDYDVGLPSPGAHRYFRVYVAMLWEDNHGDGNGMDGIEHGMESADLGWREGGGGGDGFNPMMLSRSNGTWNPGFREISTGHRFASSIGLAKFRTYRLEWHIAYGVGTYTIEVRIYDSANRLVVTTSDFVRRNPFPIGDLLSNSVLTLASPQDHRWFRVGSNGPTSNYPGLNVDVGDAFRAHGAVAICVTNWCGPYVPGESP